MSLKAIINIVVYLQTLRNIDLFNKGPYCIKIRIQNATNKKQVRQIQSKKKFGYPYKVLEIKNSWNGQLKLKQKIENQKYITKCFWIKNIDEQIILEEAIIFKLQIDTYPKMDTSNVLLHLDLFYGDNLESKVEQLKYGSTLSIKLNNLQKGIFNYASMYFEQKYKATINFYVFSILTQYKFKLLQKQQSKYQFQQILNEVQNLNKYYKSYYQKNGRTANHFYEDYIKTFRFLSQLARYQIKKNIKFNINHHYFKKLPKYVIQQPKRNSTFEEALNYLDEIEVSDQVFNRYLNTFSLKNLDLIQLQKQMQNISTENKFVFQKFTKSIQQHNINKEYLKQEFIRLMRTKSQQVIFKSCVKAQQLSIEYLSGKKKNQIAKNIRKKLLSKKQISNNLEIIDYFSELPIVFYQITQNISKNQIKIYQQKVNTLFVLSHGYQGTSLDMIFIRNTFKQFFPSAYFLIATSNVGLTNGDIIQMGQRLANEIILFVQEEHIEDNLVINMIGHSLGGLILRASLDYLKQKKYRLGIFFSLSVPHLGYLSGTKITIGAGLWITKKWKNALSFQQLSFSDKKDMRQAALYKLSIKGSLKQFKHIILVSSYSDHYVGWHSARIQHYKSQIKNNQKLKIEDEMINNILGDSQQSQLKKIHRIQISFEKFQRNIDAFIGRTAHIRFLIDQSIIQTILYCVGHLFI